MFYKTVRLIATGHSVFALLEILNSWYILALKSQKGLSILDSVHTSGQLSEQKCARNMCMVYNIENFLANSMVYLFLSYVHCGPSYLA